MSKIANSTAGNAVYSATGSRLYGLDAELALKAEDKRDKDWEKKLLIWIEEVTGEKCENKDDFGESLKTGVLLCKLINAIEANSIKKVDMRAIPICWVSNINQYLKACWQMGIDSTYLFVTSDLYPGKDINNVVQNVHAVSKLASSKPGWKGPVFTAVRQASKPVKIDIFSGNPAQAETTTKVQTQQANPAQNSPQTMLCQKCSKEIPIAAKFCGFCGNKRDELLQDSSLQDKIKEEIKAIEILETKLKELQQIFSKEKEEIESLILQESKLTKDNNLLQQQLTSLSSKNETNKDKDQNITQLRDIEEKLNKIEKQIKNEQDNKLSLLSKLKELEIKMQSNTKEKLDWKSKQELETKTINSVKTQYEKEKLDREKWQSSAENEKLSRIEVQNKYENLLKSSISTISLNEDIEDVDDVLEEQEEEVINEEYTSATTVTIPTTTTTTEIDNEEYEKHIILLKELMNSVTISRPVNEFNTETFVRLFSKERGRRQFSKIATQKLKEMSSFVVSTQSFILLTELINRLLYELDLAPTRDFITVKKLMKCASCICTKSIATSSERSKTEFIRDYICNHQVFKDIDFWQELLYDEVYTKQRKYFPDDQQVDKDFISTLCCSFVLNMEINWKLPSSLVDNFVGTIVHSKALSADDPKALENDIMSFLQRSRQKNIDKELGSGKVTTTNTTSSKKEDKSKTTVVTTTTTKEQDSKKRGFTLFNRKQLWNNIPEGEIAKEGYLMKKGAQRRNWKLRWFVLKPRYLIYLAGISDKKPKGVIMLEKCYITISDRKTFAFSINYDSEAKREWFIEAASKIERQQWMEAIQGCIIDPIPGGIQDTLTSISSSSSPQQSDTTLPTPKSYVVAQHDYIARESNELSFKETDIVEIIKTYPGSDWKKGKLGDVIGMFPGNYCSPLEKGVGLQAIYDYDGQEDNELSFKEGDLIRIVEKLDDSWYVGRINGSTKFGMFPVNFTTELVQ